MLCVIFIRNKTPMTEIGIFKCEFQMQVEMTRVSDHWKTGEMMTAGWGKSCQMEKHAIHLFCFSLSEAMVLTSETEQVLLDDFSKILLATQQEGNE